MKCMYCGAELSDSAYCPVCGRDISVQRQAIVLSGIYYNEGLEKAEVRDLSGAILLLRQSLKFNKENIQARNLLGLVYFEMGEAVSALSEWVISRNLKPDHNLATRYISEIERDGAKFDVIRHTIKKYNGALANCRSGNEDVAEIQLKKLLAQNPKLIKGYHLLALLYMKHGEWEKARKLLKKAIRIDRTNTTTLRFLREIDRETGVVTKLEPRFSFFGGQESGEDHPQIRKNRKERKAIQIRETPLAVTAFSMVAGFLVGAAAIWFLFVPVRTAQIQQEANRKVIEYSTDMAENEEKMQLMQSELEASREAVANVNDEIAAASVKAAAYENLAKAVNAYNNNEFDQAMNALQAVDLSQLSVEARSICAELGGTTMASMLQNFRASGLMAYNNGNYEEAVKALEKAKAIEDEDYDVLLYLGHSYRMMGDTVSADENYKRIITLWPDTNRSATAVEFVTDYSDIFQSQEPAAADNAAAAAPAAPENAAPENPAP